jgi:RNA:NAD 2'-phosphotransferase (TPT1/KptA family)
MAPRIRQRLIEAMVRFDDTSRPIAETYRRVGAEAERLGLTRPSYQRIRELVHQARNVRPRLTVTDVIRIVTTRPKTTDHGLELLSELGVKPIALWGLSSERPRPP